MSEWSLSLALCWSSALAKGNILFYGCYVDFMVSNRYYCLINIEARMTFREVDALNDIFVLLFCGCFHVCFMTWTAYMTVQNARN